jgi:hypothetical protein
MIPLLGILLSIYLAFKGIEIFQIAYSNKDAPFGSLVLGAVMMVLGILIGILFAMFFIDSGGSVPSIPRI